jgi:2-polyprenyl-3-methyl-5-hydroxy-6-metoxy-1,4-benzoquinol methylase
MSLDHPIADPPETATFAYTEYLRGSVGLLAGFRQLPYMLHIRSLRLGNILDLGCGIGRNLAHNGGDGVGIDHNATSVSVARARGLTAFTPSDFFVSSHATKSYDAIVCAHVAEHMTHPEFAAFVRPYLPLLSANGRFVLLTPQQRGYASDPTHVTYIDFAMQRSLLEALGLSIEKQYSFPFPKRFGEVFTHNEFVSVARKV